MTAELTQIRGRCPRGCGETLFIGLGGYVTCSYVNCPDPMAAHRMLNEAELFQKIREVVQRTTVEMAVALNGL